MEPITSHVSLDHGSLPSNLTIKLSKWKTKVSFFEAAHFFLFNLLHLLTADGDLIFAIVFSSTFKMQCNGAKPFSKQIQSRSLLEVLVLSFMKSCSVLNIEIKLESKSTINLTSYNDLFSNYKLSIKNFYSSNIQHCCNNTFKWSLTCVPASIGLGMEVNPVLTHVTVSFPRFHLHSHERGHPWPEVVTAASSSWSAEAAIDEAVEAAEAVDPIGRMRRTQQRMKRGLLMSLILTSHLKWKRKKVVKRQNITKPINSRQKKTNN